MFQSQCWKHCELHSINWVCFQNQLRLGSMATLCANGDSGAATLVMYSRTSASLRPPSMMPSRSCAKLRPTCSEANQSVIHETMTSFSLRVSMIQGDSVMQLKIGVYAMYIMYHSNLTYYYFLYLDIFSIRSLYMFIYTHIWKRIVRASTQICIEQKSCRLRGPALPWYPCSYGEAVWNIQISR